MSFKEEDWLFSASTWTAGIHESRLSQSHTVCSNVYTIHRVQEAQPNFCPVTDPSLDVSHAVKQIPSICNVDECGKGLGRARLCSATMIKRVPFGRFTKLSCCQLSHSLHTLCHNPADDRIAIEHSEIAFLLSHSMCFRANPIFMDCLHVRACVFIHWCMFCCPHWGFWISVRLPV